MFLTREIFSKWPDGKAILDGREKKNAHIERLAIKYNYSTCALSHSAMFKQMFSRSRSHAIRKCLKVYTVRANCTTGSSIVLLAVDNNLQDVSIQIFLDKKLGTVRWSIEQKAKMLMHIRGKGKGHKG